MDIISSIYVFLLFAVVATGHLEAGRLNAHVPSIRSRGTLLHSLPLRTDPEVLVVFLVGQGRERHLVINQLIPPNLFFHTYKVIQAAFEHWYFKHVLFGSVFFCHQNLLPFIVSVRLGFKGAWTY